MNLREVTADNVRSVCKLAVKEDQKPYVASNPMAIAEAGFFEEDWLRAIYADETPIGLAVIKVDTKKAKYFLWRFMIDAQYQQLNFGRKAIELLIKHVKAQENASEFTTGVVLGDNCPQGFYENLGFELTGEWYDGEAILSLSI